MAEASSTSTTKPKNVAAWSLKEKSRPVVVSNASYTSPSKGEVVIRVSNIAINPIDWIIQSSGAFKLDYPTVLGLDMAGEIVEVGKDVDAFTVGERVIAHGNGYGANKPSHGAFQKFAVVPAIEVAALPSSIAEVDGVVLPLGISTAAAGLYQKGFLALPFPDAHGKPKPLHRTLVVWGGSSSVGSCAIQLAVASGAEVFATASPRNFEYCKRLGAKQVFDYHDSSVEDEVVDALKGKTLVGVFHAVGADGAVQACGRIADRARGKAVLVSVRPLPEEGIPSSVRAKAIGSSAIFTNDVGPYVWGEFLPKAMEKGTIVPKPDALVVGNGLNNIQRALDKQKAGVSAAKVVVSKIQEDNGLQPLLPSAESGSNGRKQQTYIEEYMASIRSP